MHFRPDVCGGCLLCKVFLLLFFGLEDEAQTLFVVEIAPHPIQQDDGFVAHAQDGA